MPCTSSTFTSFQMAARYMAGYIIKNKLPIESQTTAVLAWELAHAALLSYYQSEGDIICLNDALRLKVLPTFNHLAIQDLSVTPIEKIDPPSDVAEKVNPTKSVVPVITLPPRGDEQKSAPHRVRFITTPRVDPEHNPFAAGARHAAAGIVAAGQQQAFFAGVTPRYRHNFGSKVLTSIGQKIPGVPCIIPKATTAAGHGYSAFAVEVREVTPRSGVHRLYGQPVNIRSEQLSEINLDHKTATASTEIRLTIRWALLGFKEKNAGVIDDMIKTFRAQNTIDTGLAAVAAYLKVIIIENARAQNYLTSVSSMQNAVTCAVDHVSYELIDGKFQARTSPRQSVVI